MNVTQYWGVAWNLDWDSGFFFDSFNAWDPRSSKMIPPSHNRASRAATLFCIVLLPIIVIFTKRQGKVMFFIPSICENSIWIWTYSLYKIQN